MNYFLLFNLPIKYKINYTTLSRKFHQLQLKYHPDIIKKKKGNIDSAFINQAYKNLKNPFLRAKHLLFINGIEDIYNKKNVFHNTSFLKKSFYLHEKFKGINKKKEIQKFFKKVLNLQKKYKTKMKLKLSQKKWKKAYLNLEKIQFLKKLKKKCNEKLQNY